jgi:hypothetical protein
VLGIGNTDQREALLRATRILADWLLEDGAEASRGGPALMLGELAALRDERLDS